MRNVCNSLIHSKEYEEARVNSNLVSVVTNLNLSNIEEEEFSDFRREDTFYDIENTT